MNQQTLILGLGNVLLTDEAVGAVIVRHLSEMDPDSSRAVYLDGGTLSFTLAGPIAEALNLIVVDAAAMGEPPGSVRVLEGDAMDRQLSAHAKSVHEVSLSDLMDMARLTDSLPERRALIGIEPKTVDWGNRLTPEVEQAVPNACNAVLALVERWSAAEGDQERTRRGFHDNIEGTQ